jgi:hypothetical protein
VEQETLLVSGEARELLSGEDVWATDGWKELPAGIGLTA